MKPVKLSSLLILFVASALLAFPACHSSDVDAAEPGDAVSVPSLDDIQAELAARRALNLQRLREYREAGVYPRNRVVEGRQANVFIDEDGHLCAVANLMWLDGERDLVLETAQTNNLVVLAEVTEGPLYDWILGSGLTQDEIARIQEPYFPFEQEDPNFGEWEDNRLNDHFVVVEEEIENNDTASLLAAARAQRDDILRRQGVEVD